jgi:hypothetical protein
MNAPYPGFPERYPSGAESLLLEQAVDEGLAPEVLRCFCGPNRPNPHRRGRRDPDCPLHGDGTRGGQA